MSNRYNKRERPNDTMVDSDDDDTLNGTVTSTIDTSQQLSSGRRNNIEMIEDEPEGVDDDDADDDDDLLNAIRPENLPGNISIDPNVGLIKKIVLTNFMTYSHMIFEPTTGLNLIIGANGTGKSSISAAICIGLNGPTNLTGRAKEAASYIKYGTNFCSIEITLEGRNKVAKKVKREMRKKDRTMQCSNKWFIGGVHSKGEDVKKLTRSFGINLDNLCQYLPQERVKEFAQQKPGELLVNTQKALDYKLFTQHQSLIDFGKKKVDMEGKLKQIQADINDNKSKNQEIYKDYKLANEFAQIKVKQNKFERGRLQIEYRDAKSSEKLAKQEYNRTHQIEQAAKDQLESLKLQAKNSAPQGRDEAAAKRKHTQAVKELEKKIENLYDEIQQEENTLKAKIKLYLKKQDEEKNREQLVLQAQHAINQFEVEYKTATKQIFENSLGEITKEEID